MIVREATFKGTPAEFEARVRAYDRRLWAEHNPPFPKVGMLVFKTGPLAHPNAAEVTVAVSPYSIQDAVNHPMSDGEWGPFPVFARDYVASITAYQIGSRETRLQLECHTDTIWPAIEQHWTDLLAELGGQDTIMPAKQTEGEAQAMAGDDSFTIISGTFGTNRDLSFQQVLGIVKQARNWQARGGKIPDFYRTYGIDPAESGGYELNTLYGWLKDPRFKDVPKKPT